MSGKMLVVKGFKAVGPFRFGMTRAACAEVNGRPDSDAFVPGLEVHREVRGRVTLEFGRDKLSLVVVHRDPGLNVTLEGHSLFDPGGIVALRALDPEYKELGAFQHFPTCGVMVGGMGKRKLGEGPVVQAASRARYKLLSRVGAV